MYNIGLGLSLALLRTNTKDFELGDGGFVVDIFKD